MIDRHTGVFALLGPTNTGKTREAIERMLRHRTGMIGLPLRLLAREVYDKVRAIKGNAVVALVTGEERIVPPTARYWICTTEAMPVGNGVDFLAVDEIQLCADGERGHVFTDRLLNARGQMETLFLGAATMAFIIREAVPAIRIEQRPRLSRLTYAGCRRIARLRPRTAIVAFTIEDVYAIADSVRRHRGGAAVVMGGLSPKTRNAQVDIYQNGDVDYLVATDAIGMGLNLDIRHVAFASRIKFDGHAIRPLHPAELAQIAGRAGRYRTRGTFGITADCQQLNRYEVESIEANRFMPIKRLQWRNSALDYRSVRSLLRTLDTKAPENYLIKVRQAADRQVLESLAESASVRRRTGTGDDVRLLWDVCQLPNFRRYSKESHADLIKRIYVFLQDNDRIPDKWLADRVDALAGTTGDIDDLAMRLAYIRTWSYVAYRSCWVGDTGYWRERTRDVEDRLSDVLHKRLTRRFVDIGTRRMVRHLKQGSELEAKMTVDGALTVDGQELGQFRGFQFVRKEGSSPEEVRALKTAAAKVVGKEFAARAGRFAKAPDRDLGFGEDACIHWDGHPVARLAAGQDAFRPGVAILIDDHVDRQVRKRVEMRVMAYAEHMISQHLGQLIALRDDEELSAPARGLAFKLADSFGILDRRTVADDIKGIDAECRTELRKYGVKIAQHSVFLYSALKPKATRLRLLLWSLRSKCAVPSPPQPGLTTVIADRSMPEGYYPLCGFARVGTLAVRVDILDRLMRLLWNLESEQEFEAGAEMLSITGTTHEDFMKIMRGLGYRVKQHERCPVIPESAEAMPDEPPDAAQAERPEDVVAVALPDSNATDVSIPDAKIHDAEPAMPEKAQDEAVPDRVIYYVYARPAQPGPRQSMNRTGRSRAKRAGAAERSARGDQRNQSERSRQDRRDRGRKVAGMRKSRKPDPDSPFAALMSLRDEL
ncbi:MAG: helicase-related protein [Rhodobacteraceae bacterium]|nr:helicase-related protein [Paracoccaceae bacterium]